MKFWNKILNKTIDKLAVNKVIGKWLVHSFLKLHNYSYYAASGLSVRLEPNNLHPKHRLMRYHDWFIKQLRPEWEILDVGCGNGALAADLAQHCKSVMGIDMNFRNIEAAKTRARGEFICADATVYNFSKKFDAIILSNVLEHIYDRVAFLKKLSQSASRFLIRVPMLDRDWLTLYKKEQGVEYRLDPTHFIEYTIDSFFLELSEAGLKVETYLIRFGEIYAVAKRGGC